MRLCTKCKLTKPIESFSTRSGNKLQSWCKQCFTDYDRHRYHNGDKERKDRNKKELYKRQRSMLDLIKLASGCVDCGYKENAKALDFDHVRGKKEFNIGDISQRSVSDERLMVEVAKCDVRCANCHRIKTYC